jgi:2-oxoglutarate/2-oxoacid ferredoxin oxidoreductase subunit beta
MEIKDFSSTDPIAWCPGCGNFGILTALKKAMVMLDQKPKNTLLVSGIGQAAKLPHYMKANCFNGLHGRALPVAVAAKIANPELSVIVTTGDGDCYGEGGNHFIHNIRRNFDITLLVHNNQIYGLTKGQASPTTDEGFITKIQTKGVILNRFNSLAVAIASGCGFVARGFSREIDNLADIIVEAVNYPGFSIVEIMQPCVSFNKKNTFDWYSERLYDLHAKESYKLNNRASALEKAFEWGDKIPTGILYKAESETYNQKVKSTMKPLFENKNTDIQEILRDYI